MSAPTPQAISALLKRAGFARATPQKGRIKGLTEHSPGFKVVNAGPGAVDVLHLLSSFRMRSPSAEEMQRKLNDYGDALRAAGWQVDPITSGIYPGLRVTEAAEPVS